MLHTHAQTQTLICGLAEKAAAREASLSASPVHAGGYAFFESLLHAAVPGTVVLVLETTHRHYGALVAAGQRGVARASEELGKSLRLQVEYPWVQSNGGYSLLLHKVEGLTRATKISPPDVLECSTSVAHLLQAFEDDGRRRRACA